MVQPISDSTDSPFASVLETSHHCPFASEEIERGVDIDGDTAQPAGELVDHDSCCDAGGIDRAA